MTLGQTNQFRLRKEGVIDQRVIELFSSLNQDSDADKVRRKFRHS